MNWNTVPGSTGKCKVYIDNYTRNDGTEGQSNKIKRFLEPLTEAAKPSWGSGKGGW